MQKMDKIAAIRSAPKFSSKPVVCNEWRPEGHEDEQGRAPDFTLWVKSLSTELHSTMMENAKDWSEIQIRYEMLKPSVFTDAGMTELAFDGFSQDEFAALNLAPRERLFNAVLRLSGVTQQDQEIIEGK